MAPGSMDVDAVDQLSQARHLTFDDWNPPFRALLWIPLDALVHGPTLMLLLQDGLIFLALATLAMVVDAPWLPLIALWPALLPLLAPVWKDTLLCGLALLAFALVTAKPRWRWMALAACLCATATRHNAALATLPLVWLAFPRKPAFVAVVWLAMVMSSEIVSHAVARPTYPLQQILTHDLIGASLEENRNLLPSGMCTAVESDCLAAWRGAYKADHTESTTFRQLPMRRISDGTELRSLIMTWLSRTARHPFAYLARRWTIAQHLFIGEPSGSVFIGSVPNPFGVDIHPSERARIATRLAQALSHTFVFSGWLYLLFGMVALALTRFAHRGIIALVMSGWLYSLGNFLGATSAEYRFNSWLMVSATTALALAARLFFFARDQQRKLVGAGQGDRALDFGLSDLAGK